MRESPPQTSATPLRVAIVIPCRDEEATIGKVVADFRAALPAAVVVVVDNGSTDRTKQCAQAAGAHVISESRRGKGFALVAGFQATRNADFVVMVDGDDTYPAERAPELLAAARCGADMVVGTRRAEAVHGAFRPFHALGNALFVSLVRLIFGLHTQDLLSGYRVLSRRFVDRSPLIATGFEIEAELSLQALRHHFTVVEVPVSYRARPPGSTSKLATYHDGYRVLVAIFTMFRDDRPLLFFGSLSIVFLALSLAGGAVVILEFLRTGLVPRLPLAVLSAALFLLGALALACGVLLSSINRRAAELAVLISRD
jgi:glycosyltransferase involved in cell wall biosynthesis